MKDHSPQSGGILWTGGGISPENSNRTNGRGHVGGGGRSRLGQKELFSLNAILEPHRCNRSVSGHEAREVAEVGSTEAGLPVSSSDHPTGSTFKVDSQAASITVTNSARTDDSRRTKYTGAPRGQTGAD